MGYKPKMPKAGEGIGWLYNAYVTIIKIKKNKILKIKNKITI